MTKRLARIAMAMLVVAGALIAAPPARAETTISITVKNHRFVPAEVHAPANVPIILKVKNLDSTPMEFESVSLRVEKVVTPNSEGTIRLRPLSPGSYNFFDDFNKETNGVLVVK
jgi:heme/copper-type cytochrome/quinol oxidase subunit 2